MLKLPVLMLASFCDVACVICDSGDLPKNAIGCSWLLTQNTQAKVFQHPLHCSELLKGMTLL